MNVVISKDTREMGELAASKAGELIKQAVAERGSANIVVATGASQFETLAALIVQKDIPWEQVTGFHLDEYIGISTDHPASFCKYLSERFVSKVPLKAFHFIDGMAKQVADECSRLSDLITAHPIDVALIGIGENGHLAFNDPPADFDTEVPYLVVSLDEACRRQQLGEGWFSTFEEIPTQAISMSVRQILKSNAIVCSVPDERKADATAKVIEGPITQDVPASILQSHLATTIFLDPPAASKLSESMSATR
ncbi:glucosamine-6-phosphate deaminase [Adhaeretor mobilis]|uniref:Glucosamine-6-phosphate deaminase 1 n=1 Tax=Adhaeretor mobilis TaxID=1930276 RepID=A0A517MWF4_9BACT|nr:glucosamine-6-phosphate deaminase [Adhaeretor mobilis]QDS99065.1 Glucosamine-6-phosphate deaminase 1 [Adhaeretor mobilis]QDS99137.1 Glucosamine-6-phosphate deaminase 1 [Adhaeretor mobilis]